jgi:hypothetical protein
VSMKKSMILLVLDVFVRLVSLVLYAINVLKHLLLFLFYIFNVKSVFYTKLVYDACIAFKPCKNGGSCVKLGSLGYTCSCLNGHSGYDCSKKLIF